MDRAELIRALLRERFGPDARHRPRPSTAPSTDDPQPDDDEGGEPCEPDADSWSGPAG